MIYHIHRAQTNSSVSSSDVELMKRPSRHDAPPNNTSFPILINRIHGGTLYTGIDGSMGAPPYGPKFSQLHAVFRKIWQNCMLVPPVGRFVPWVCMTLRVNVKMYQDESFTTRKPFSRKLNVNLPTGSEWLWVIVL